LSKQFTGKTSLVTGGGSGIGRAAAPALAAEGCTVTVAARTAAALEGTVHAIKAAGGAGGRLDFAVNSAGVDGGDNTMTTAEYSTEVLDQMIATNVRGMFVPVKYELR
jgi:NAD(P)-dependent dehydrogenase (short-subunit alcohol dehydrogenase family)